MKKIYTFLLLLSSIVLFGQDFIETNFSSSSNDGTGIYVNTNGYRTANDITVYPNYNLNLKNISFNAVVQSGGQIDSIDLTIYDDNNGMPGNIVYTQNGIIPNTFTNAGNSLDIINVDISLDVLLAGQINQATRYWISPVATVSNTQLVWWELTNASTNGMRIYEHTMGYWDLKDYGDGVYTFSGDLSPVSGSTCDPMFARSENFEIADITNHCWSLHNTGSANGFMESGQQAHSGSSSYARLSADGDGTSYLVSPPLSILYFDYLSFWYYQHNTANFGASKVLISTTSNDPVNHPNEFVELISLDDSSNGGFSEDTWTQHKESLHQFAGQTVYIVFQYTGGTNMHDLYIDDFEVTYEHTAYNFPETALNVDILDESTVCNNFDQVVSGANNDLGDSMIADPGCANYAGGDLWLKFIAPDEGGIQMVFPAYSVVAYSKVGYALYDNPQNNPPLQCGITNTYFGGAPTFDTEYVYFTGLTPGETYYLRIWDDNNNDTGAIYFCLLAYTDPNAIGIYPNQQIELYPNPAHDMIYINSDEKINQVEIYNVSGKQILRKQVNTPLNTLDVQSLDKGLYFIKLSLQNKNIIKKIIIE